MNRFTYQVYYESSPFKEQKAPEEIVGALSAFSSDLYHFLDDPKAHVDRDCTEQTPTSIFVIVTTTLSEQQVDDGIRLCLNAFDLLGKKIQQ